ncbi:MFS general substrate transporter [Acrodontium crateriforme]|uniref:MFS general substrate transporter n=1 Tax=Acrodontium crateriforme TaxID=150365 RepID=A0AAQ3MCI1_9PEZI|nr:MFS general substrate transporter [Acrodontium crateriforme]
MVLISSWTRLLNTLQLRNDYSEHPAGLEWRSSSAFVITTVTVGMFSDIFLYSLIVPILPFMLQDRIGVPDSEIQSAVSRLLSTFAVSSVVFSPVAGFLADKVSSRSTPFLFGLATMIASTVLLFLGRTFPILILSRVLQGVSGALIWTIGLALVVETVGAQNLGATIGTIFSITSAGALCAPPIGGILYEKIGYPGVFGVACAVLVVDFIMRLLVIETRIARRYKSNDGSSSGTSTPRNLDGAADDEQSTILGEEQPLLGTKDEDLTPYIISPNQSSFARMVTIAPCLSNPSLLTALLICLIQATLVGASDATIPLVASDYFGFDSLKAGLLFLPLGVCDMIFGPFFGWMVDRYGTRPMSVFSYVFLIPVLILLRLPHQGGHDQIILYGSLLGLYGIGISAISGPSIVEASAIIEKYHKANPEFYGKAGPNAQLYGLSNMLFSLGLAIGPELGGGLKEAIGYGNMNAVLAGLCVFTAIMCLCFFGEERPAVGPRKGDCPE